MEKNNKRKQMILITACGAVIVCLAGAIAAVAFALRKNPLAEGLMELAKEVTALEEEMGCIRFGKSL